MYLQQLSESSAASIPPPGVTRTLASKACRHAIMFGDPLSADQSHELICGLLNTSLWSICAHGRPTNASLASLELLQGMISVRQHVAGIDPEAVQRKGSKHSRFCARRRQPHATHQICKPSGHGRLQQLSKRLRSWQRLVFNSSGSGHTND